MYFKNISTSLDELTGSTLNNIREHLIHIGIKCKPLSKYQERSLPYRVQAIPQVGSGKYQNLTNQYLLKIIYKILDPILAKKGGKDQLFVFIRLSSQLAL